MNAKQIQREIIESRWRTSTTVPNYTPKNWFECDVFEVTKSGYFREYEVKISRADFFADAEKFKRQWKDLTSSEEITKSKHNELARGALEGPSEFYFVTPINIVQLSDIPSWSGWIVAEDSPRRRQRVNIVTVKKAPRLHKVKINPEIEQHARGVCYYRFLSIWMARASLQGDCQPSTSPK